MADSDGEYVDNASSDDYEDHHVTRERGEDRQPAARPGSSHRRHHPGGLRDSSGGGGGGGGGGAGGHHRRDGGGRRRRGERRENQAAWETVKRSWDTVGEAEDGQVLGVELLEAAEKRRRVLREDATPLQRGIIRHLVLVLDMSAAMASRDYLPTCHRVAQAAAADFVRAYFEQNPISQLAVVAMRDGVAVRVSDMGGNPAEHLERLRAWDRVEPQGQPSLQNALEMARGALFHAPAHGTREVLVLFGALLSSDPGDIHDTVAALVADGIRVSVVGLAAQVAICSEICARTNGGDDRSYAVALHDVHFRELVLAATTPPATTQPAEEDGAAAAASSASGRPKKQTSGAASLLMMGFPSRALADATTTTATTTTTTTTAAGLSVCACHNKPVREGYACTRCRVKVCRLPAECPSCGLTLILSTHLARSYHHLFPLRNWVEVPWPAAAAAVRRRGATACHACLAPFPDLPPPEKLREMAAAAATAAGGAGGQGVAAAAEAGSGVASAAPPATAAGAPAPGAAALKGVSESGRYACPVCGHHFCIDCDVFAHEVLHNCPGCQSDTRPPAEQEADARARAADVAAAAAAAAASTAAAAATAAASSAPPPPPAAAAAAARPKTKIRLKVPGSGGAAAATGGGDGMVVD